MWLLPLIDTVYLKRKKSSLHTTPVTYHKHHVPHYVVIKDWLLGCQMNVLHSCIVSLMTSYNSCALVDLQHKLQVSTFVKVETLHY